MRQKDLLIVPIDAEAIDVLLKTKDRNAALKALHQATVIGAARPTE